jgi:zinc and cadmium transporter
MQTFWWIFLGGVLMSAIALVGSVTFLLKEATLSRLVMPLVDLAAGSLLGGAFFHMLPAALEQAPADPTVFLWILIGFTLFFALEQSSVGRSCPAKGDQTRFRRHCRPRTAHVWHPELSFRVV